MRDVSSVWQHHGQRQDPDQRQHQADGETLGIWPNKCLVSVNAEGKKAQHDGIAGKVLRIVSDKCSDSEGYLDDGKEKAEELPKKPVVDEQDKE